MSSGDEDDRIPVVLVTGFLGAGKTTLLNHLIRDPSAGRIAVIMNEFGAVGLDHDLIEEATDEVVLMQSGCLCCTFRGDISETLRSLIERRSSGELVFDRVVIETTGIADPAPILHTLVIDDFIAEHFRMDGVVTLVDAANGSRTLDRHVEAVQQVAMADMIVVTKSDLVAAQACEDLEARLEVINPSAHRLRADHGRAPVGALFNLSALVPNATPEDIASWLDAKQSRADQVIAKTSDEMCDGLRADTAPPRTLQARHGLKISSASIEVAEPIPPGVFEFALDMLMSIAGTDILRLKGIVHVEGVGHPLVLHGVQHIVNAPVFLESWTGTDTVSRIVVIGRNLEDNEVDKCLEMFRMRLESAEPSAEHEAYEVPF